MTSDNRIDKNARLNLYRTIWRWHFYAGLCCIPIMLTLAVSGTIYLFKPQFDHWVDQPYQQLTPINERYTANEQIAAAIQAVPDSVFVNYRLPEDERDAVVISLRQAGEVYLVYVNPFTLDILKTIKSNDQFMDLVHAFHGELLSGTTGSVIVELAGSWAIVLILTGLYLNWPRSAGGLYGVLLPRLKQGRRIFWRDLHSVTGVWISLLILFLLISGLPWTLVWGSGLKELRQWNEQQTVSQDWTISSDHHDHHNHAASLNSVAPPLLSEPLLASAQALNFAPPVELSLTPGSTVWQLKSQHQNRPLRASAWLSESGDVIKIEHFKDRPLLDRIIGIGIAAHEGQLFGWLNQLLGVVVTSGLVMICISGVVMWYRRRPGGGLGAPPVPVQARVGKGVVAIIFVLALLLPLLAISIVCLFVLERLVLRQADGLRQWLGGG